MHHRIRILLHVYDIRVHKDLKLVGNDRKAKSKHSKTRRKKLHITLFVENGIVLSLQFHDRAFELPTFFILLFRWLPEPQQSRLLWPSYQL